MDSFSIQNYFKRGKTVVLTLRHGDEEGARQWSDKDTQDLLKLMNDFLPEFQSPARRKKDVWDDVSKEFQNAGHNWTSEDCRKKWSNMIRTFRGIEEQKQDPTSNFKRVKWPFYDVMKQLLSLEGSDSYPEALTVVQLLKGNPTPSQPSSSATFRKTTVFETSEGQRFSASIPQLLRDSPVLQTAAPQQFVVNETDVLGVVTLTDAQDHLQSSTGHALDTHTYFSEPTTTTTPPQPSPPTTSFSTSFQSKPLIFKPVKKKLTKSKGGKGIKKAAEESTDDLFQKFMESTQKQNDQLLERMTTFHENALTMMQERNDLLRELRDMLQEGRVTNENNLSQPDSLNTEGDDTLTFHMGPAYSTNPGVIDGSTRETNVSAQLTSTLVMSDADPTATATALSSFQLEDGTNLESFTESVIPEVTLLHPTLVSVGQVISNSPGNEH